MLTMISIYGYHLDLMAVSFRQIDNTMYTYKILGQPGAALRGKTENEKQERLPPWVSPVPALPHCHIPKNTKDKLAKYPKSADAMQ